MCLAERAAFKVTTGMYEMLGCVLVWVLESVMQRVAPSLGLGLVEENIFSDIFWEDRQG